MERLNTDDIYPTQFPGCLAPCTFVLRIFYSPDFRQMIFKALMAPF